MDHFDHRARNDRLGDLHLRRSAFSTEPLRTARITLTNNPIPMIKKILLALLAVIVIILIVAAFQPSTFHVERSAVVQAPPSVVYATVNDFHNWSQFNPWQELDTNAKVSFEGPMNGTGAKFNW